MYIRTYVPQGIHLHSYLTHLTMYVCTVCKWRTIGVQCETQEVRRNSLHGAKRFVQPKTYYTRIINYVVQQIRISENATA